MTAIEVLSVLSIPSVLAWFTAAVLPKHSPTADKLVAIALITSFIVVAASVVYGVWWLSQHICY